MVSKETQIQNFDLAKSVFLRILCYVEQNVGFLVKYIFEYSKLRYELKNLFSTFESLKFSNFRKSNAKHIMKSTSNH